MGDIKGAMARETIGNGENRGYLLKKGWETCGGKGGVSVNEQRNAALETPGEVKKRDAPVKDEKRGITRAV